MTKSDFEGTSEVLSFRLHLEGAEVLCLTWVPFVGVDR